MGRPEISLKEHRNILNAFIDRDSQRAEQEASLHIEHALELYQEMLRKDEKRERKVRDEALSEIALITP